MADATAPYEKGILKETKQWNAPNKKVILKAMKKR